MKTILICATSAQSLYLAYVTTKGVTWNNFNSIFNIVLSIGIVRSHDNSLSIQVKRSEGNVVVSLDTKPLAKPMLAKISDAIWHWQATMSWFIAAANIKKISTSFKVDFLGKIDNHTLTITNMVVRMAAFLYYLILLVRRCSGVVIRYSICSIYYLILSYDISRLAISSFFASCCSYFLLFFAIFSCDMQQKKLKHFQIPTLALLQFL